MTEAGNQGFPSSESEGRLVPRKRDEQNAFSHFRERRLDLLGFDPVAAPASPSGHLPSVHLSSCRSCSTDPAAPLVRLSPGENPISHLTAFTVGAFPSANPLWLCPA